MAALLDGDIPLVSAKNVNNGLKKFASSNGKKKYEAGTISLNNDGDGGVGMAFYQPYEYLLDSHCTSLQSKIEMTTAVKLFICACVTKQRCLFSHGRAISEERLKMLTVILPVNEKGLPDYRYMDLYGNSMMEQMYSSYIDYCNAK